MTGARVLIAVAIALAPVATTDARARTTLVGTVVNATRGHDVPVGLRVEAAPVDADGTRGIAAVTKVDRRGRFQFRNLEDARHYQVATRYRGVIYTTTFEAPGNDAPAVRLAIFETTASLSDLRLNAITTILDAREDGTLDALEVLRVRNAGDRAFVGDSPGEGVVELPLPEGAFDTRAEEGTPGLTESGGRFFTQSPVQPGETRISYSYRLPSSDTGWSLERTPAYDARRADLLVGPGVRVAPGAGLELLGNLDFKGAEYRQYRLMRVRAGRALEVDLVAAAGTERSSFPVVVVAAALAVALGLLVARRTVMEKIRSAGGTREVR